MSINEATEKQMLVMRVALGTILDPETEASKAAVKADMWERNDGNGTSDTVVIGDTKTKVTFVGQSATKTLVGRGEEFEQFMREHGMVKEVIDDGWTKCVVQAGSEIIWEETGEVVPGVVFQLKERAAYVKVGIPKNGTDEAWEILNAAYTAGMLDSATIQMLGGGDGD